LQNTKHQPKEGIVSSPFAETFGHPSLSTDDLKADGGKDAKSKADKGGLGGLFRKG